MDKQKIEQLLIDYVDTAEGNSLNAEQAINPDLVGLNMYEHPILAYGLANDELFTQIKEDARFKDFFMLPDEWLGGAKSIISIFFPFTQAVIDSNAKEKHDPSLEWLQARIEGQNFLNDAGKLIAESLRQAGYHAVVPSIDARFQSLSSPAKTDPALAAKVGLTYTSNWSERHVAYVCGMGTFSLSKGIITERGMAGRLSSIITDLYLEPTTRTYSSLEENCIKCGACIAKCPAGAISKDGKEHLACALFLDEVLEKYKPRYGCGKCQVKVPCSRSNPKKK